MPKAQTIQTFTYQELEGKARQRATDWLGEIVSESAVDDVKDLFESELGQRGLSTLKAWWSLGHVQGDGVWLEGHIYLDDIEPIQGEEGHGDQQADEGHIDAIRQAANGLADDLDISVRYESYRNSMDVEVEHRCSDYEKCDANKAEAVELEVRDLVEAWLKDLCQRLARMGYQAFDDSMDEGYLADIADGNEYRFDKYGNPVHHILEGGA